MQIGVTQNSLNFKDYNEWSILATYFPQVTHLPYKMISPFRTEEHPSFSFYLTPDNHIKYKDFGTGDGGNIIDLLSRCWHCSYKDAFKKVCDSVQPGIELPQVIKERLTTVQNNQSSVELQVTIRQWQDFDFEYWASYGIEKKYLLNYADIFPISYKHIIKTDKKTGETKHYILPADRYAYCFIEKKDSKIGIKIYQPFNTKGYKWCSKMDRSTWGLWTKIPKKGTNLFISSSVKDCLNLTCNLHIPAICMQGEGYLPKPKVMEELKSRYSNIIVFFDNDYTNPDNPGRTDSVKLAEKYNLKRVEIPEKYEAKDPSDLFKKYGKEKYLQVMKEILTPLL